MTSARNSTLDPKSWTRLNSALVRGTKMRTLPFSMVFFRGGVCAAAVGFSCEIGFLSSQKHGTINAAKVLSIWITFLLLPTQHFRLCLTSEPCGLNTATIIFKGCILIPWRSNQNWLEKHILAKINHVQNSTKYGHFAAVEYCLELHIEMVMNP